MNTKGIEMTEIKESEIQQAYNKLMESMEGMAKDAKGWKVSDISAVSGMTKAIVNLKKELLESKQELAELKSSLPKIKADAVRTLLDDSSNWDSRIDGELYFTSSSIAAHADKIEEGV